MFQKYVEKYQVSLKPYKNRYLTWKLYCKFVMHISNFGILETFAILWFGYFENGTLCKTRKRHSVSEAELSDNHTVNCFINQPIYRKLCQRVANSWHQRATSTERQRLLQYGMYGTELRWCKVVLTHRNAWHEQIAFIYAHEYLITKLLSSLLLLREDRNTILTLYRCLEEDCQQWRISEGMKADMPVNIAFRLIIEGESLWLNWILK